jgi:hypothetical protein
MNNNKPTQFDYIKILRELERSVYPKNPLKKREANILKMRLNYIKDNWKYSIKPIILNYNLFDFKIKLNEFGEKTTPWSRLKDLFLSVFYIVKTTLTHVPLGYKH